MRRPRDQRARVRGDVPEDASRGSPGDAQDSRLSLVGRAAPSAIAEPFVRVGSRTPGPRQRPRPTRNQPLLLRGTHARADSGVLFCYAISMSSRALSAARTPAGTDAPTHVTHAGPGAAMSMTRQTHRDTPPGRCRGARWGSPRLPGLRARLRDDSGREMSGCACPWSEPSETSPRATVHRPNGTNKRTWMKKSEN